MISNDKNIQGLSAPNPNGTPAHPEHPEHPEHPAHPEHPGHPEHPAHPEYPGHPEHPTHPEHPGHPEHPTHPEHPDHPEHPNPPKPDKTITIIVNAQDKVLPIGTERVSYEDVVKLAYGSYDSSSNVVYTVVFSNGPVENPKGALVLGQSAKVREGMIFNVGRSDKS